ncbi:hypothetical protein NQ314_005806 [Rhamnusium bicolor]|uniref:Aminopeptidase P N-terminal domain-containing protein n=1 Tax=Rhamnusium bicolor TaxID=1586634 RepID=A0AAV8ZEC0_9CUCU|nr:hypothetical protein NQ314_005806 [Rhamnusium bicolor]
MKIQYKLVLDLFRNFCMKAAKSKVKSPSVIKKHFGQASFETHPHLINEGEVTPLITKCEYQERRYNLVESIMSYAEKHNQGKNNHVIVIPAASKQYMSDKIPYVFRQNTEFLYLTGCQEPDCCVVITTGNSPEQYCTTLFTRDKDEHAELWDGPRTHPEDAPGSTLWYDFITPVQNSIHKVICEFMNESGDKKWDNPKSFIHKLRLYKSPAEIALMQKSCDITAQAFVEAMACSKPGIGENQIFAKVDYECRLRGAEFLAYPPVVAGGNRATIIHYINNNQIVKDDEMVLMDAGCEYHGYASDVTRTWPINGKFTAQQREIYEVVYSVQQELIELCNKLPTLDALFESMCQLLGKRLQEIGLIGIQPSENYLMRAAYKLCPHHVSHYLGMDIHDTPTVNRNINIEPGMIITIEPGIDFNFISVYISENNKSLPKQYHGIGIRIEDDVLITVNGPLVLSRKCPKHIDDIEKIIAQRQ